MKSAAKVIQQRKEQIIDRWDKLVRENIEASRENEPLALRNFLPVLLDELSTALEENPQNNPEDEGYQNLIKISENHGRHRSSSQEYNTKQIIQEFVALFEILIDEFSSAEVFTPELSKSLLFVLGTSVASSAGAFDIALQEMREKLVGVLAHDIRNPISAAYLALDVLDHKDGEKRFKLVKGMAVKSLQTSLEMLEGMLDAIRVQAGQGMALRFSASDLVPKVKLEHQESSQIYSNPIKLVCEEESIKGIFDATLVKRALGNLITNAIKYGAPRQPVTIKIEDKGEKVFLSVHNLGDPIPAEKQKEIFKFMSRSGRNPSRGTQGWGMGLTLVELVSEAHGGKVLLQSNATEGTTFTMILQKNSNPPGKKRAELNYSKE